MFSFFQKRASKSRKPEHEKLAIATYYREMTTFLSLIGLLIVGVMANFISAYYDAAHSKPATAQTTYRLGSLASSTPEKGQN